jgi:hypothetical protein
MFSFSFFVLLFCSFLCCHSHTQRFAVSRMQSGSHLMACALALERGWHPQTDIDLKVIGAFPGTTRGETIAGCECLFWLSLFYFYFYFICTPLIIFFAAVFGSFPNLPLLTVRAAPVCE